VLGGVDGRGTRSWAGSVIDVGRSWNNIMLMCWFWLKLIAHCEYAHLEMQAFRYRTRVYR